MQNHTKVEIRLEGNVPSKKNSRINRFDGKSFPSKKYYDWHKYAIQQVRLQTRARFFKPVSIHAKIIFGTNVRADIDNRLTSILDMLTDALVICDDKWQSVPKISACAEYDKGKPGAIIIIEELDN